MWSSTIMHIGGFLIFFLQEESFDIILQYITT